MKKHSDLADYCSSHSLRQRDVRELLPSVIEWLRWLHEQHLSGQVAQVYRAIGIRHQQVISLPEGLIKPKVNFARLKNVVWENLDLTYVFVSQSPVREYWGQLTGSNTVANPFIFSAPEERLGHHDQRSDIWSVGFVLAALFSDFTPLDVASYKALCRREVDVCNWYFKELAPVVGMCLLVNPALRIQLTGLIQLLQQFAEGELDNGRIQHSVYASHLKKLKLAVLDFSNRNPLFHFGLTRGFVEPQMALSSFISMGKNWSFPHSIDPLLLSLHSIRRLRNQQLRDRGEDSLWCVTHWMEWEYEGQTRKTPLLLLRVNLLQAKSLALEYQLRADSPAMLVNEVLRIFLADRLELQLPQAMAYDETALADFFNRLCTNLELLGAGPVQIVENLLVGNLSYHHYAIGANYNDMLRQSPNPICLELMGLEGQGDQNSPIGKKALPWSNIRVLPSDPSQDRALDAASQGSMVIEGPPGTGKSQTIVNLIAQALDAGERVLFVSEKRAALEVVYRRMEQAGIADLALLACDTLRDRKSMVDSIRTSYAKLMAALERDAKLGTQLASWRLEEAVNEIDHYWNLVRSTAHGFALNELFIDRPPGLIQSPEHLVPGYDSWLKDSHILAQLSAGLLRNEGHEVWRQSVLAQLNARVFATNADPIRHWAECLESLNKVWNRADELFKKAGLPPGTSLGQLLQLTSLARSSAKLVQRNMFRLLMDDTTTRRDYEKLKNKYLTKKTMLEKRAGKIGQLGQLDYLELSSALARVKRDPNDPEVLAFVQAHLQAQELFFGHMVEEILEHALRQAKATWQVHEMEGLFLARYGCHQPMEFIQEIDLLHDLSLRTQPHIPQIFEYLHTLRRPEDVLRTCLEYQADLAQLETAAAALDQRFRDQTLQECKQSIGALEGKAFGQAQVELLQLFNSLSPDVKYCLSQAFSSIANLGLDAKRKELARAFVAHPNLEQYNSQKVNQCLDVINQCYEELLAWNSARLLDRYASKFQQKVRAAQTPADRLSQSEKLGRNLFKKGLRLLHIEMDKQRKFKSLRSILLDGHNTALMGLKPVFLLSPVAVAEVFPCVAGLFDLVIFDEAGQLRMEEVLPVCHRAKRVVVVGDSQQLPPSAFFRAKSNLNDDIDNLLKFNSFFAAARAAFPGHSLEWHYRSSHQSLIAFNNLAFYNGLLTAFPSFDSTYKPLVFTQINDGIYQNRQNQVEADAVVTCLAQEMGLHPELSYAVIAFSQAQQEAIERSLERYKKEDLAFARILDREETRYESGVFSGLLIKNLENMQGEERDVVLVSVGYGPNEEGRLAQHYGPIMHEGGDRRINVLSSRARLQIRVFCSFDPDQIANRENAGIWMLKQWLRYVRAHHLDQQADVDNILRLIKVNTAAQRETDKNDINQRYNDRLNKWLIDHCKGKGVELHPLLTGAGESNAYFFSVWNEEKESGVLYETEPQWIDTWKEFFVSRRIMSQRGYRVHKLSTQFMKMDMPDK